MARVLVTRPQPGAAVTARHLAALGHVSVVMPLSTIVPLETVFPDGDSLDAVAATSASALRAAPTNRLTLLLGKPCFAVGDATAEAARSKGFTDVRIGGGDARSLAAAMGRDMAAGSRILYLCGRVRRRDFEGELAAAGMICRAAETYDTVFPQLDDGTVRAALSDQAVDYALVYSAESASALAGVVARSESASLFEKTYFLCLSANVADRLSALPGACIRVGAAPNEEALLALLPSD